MPRLTRKNIKVFAGSATNNGVFGSLQANNPTTTSDVEQLQSLSAWSDGWNAATETSEELPPLEEIQGVEYVTTYQQAYIMQEGLPEWAATVTYYKGCLTKEVTSTGFKIYNSLTDNNTGNLLSDTSNWKKVMDSDDVYAFDNTVVHKTGNETIAGVKTFTEQPRYTGITTASASMDSTALPTVGYLNNPESSLNVVHRSGNETIGGDKTFNNRIHFKNSVYVDAAAGDEGGEIEFAKAPNSSLLGNVKLDVYKNSMRIFGPASNGDIRNIIDADIENNALFVPPSDKINAAISTIGINKNQNGYIRLGNGIIIQWGAGYSNPVTFPTPFSSIPAVTGSPTYNGRTQDGHGYVWNVTTTSFEYRCDNDMLPYRWIAIGY
jgi:hypothetical protein